MIGPMSAHRRANAFAHLLDESRLDRPGLDEEETAAPEDRREQTALLAVVEKLAALPGPELSPGTRTAQRAQLVAAMESAFAEGMDPAESPSGGPSAGRVPGQRRARGAKGAHRATQGGVLARLKPTTRLTKGLAASGLTVGVAAGAFGGVAAASTDALPGDTLYGFKRGMEDLRLDFADGDMDRGQLYLDHASRRMGEARRLLERGRSGPLDSYDLDAIHRALASMRDDAAEGHRLLSRVYQADGSIDPIRSLSAFADDHRDTWAHLRGRLPAPLWDVGVEVTDVFNAMDEEIGPLTSLLPERTETTSSAGGTGGGASASQRPGGHAPEHPATSPEPGGTHDQRDPEDRDRAGESEPPGDGLLDGGLLTPEGREPGPEASSPPGATEPGRLLPEPDVTIPPLVDDLLPDLGLDPEEP
ncbi:DUF5667 domain-containing protein [Streptomyces sp. PT12]|uniref:DUF5667 domain-containing protein n=1 Tax=Streptomyces sp. PT12 TaxID=1510197 RepID=UPI000DE3C8FF|nr:DUF5667 domain-containing protein [Streptomyces sp. PT12]RBM17909.1 hypothetical protein DEH69_14665 [Streptomyces sp. PT12]